MRRRGGETPPGTLGRVVPMLVALALSLLPGAGCAPPDQPALLPPPVPPATLALFPEVEDRNASVAPGVFYYGLRSPEVPWAIHLLRVELDRCELGLRVVSSVDDEGRARGLSRVTELLQGAGDAVMAGVNGDFFTPEGLTVGTEVVGGTVRRVRARPVLAWRPGGAPWMGLVEAEGDSALLLGWRVDRRRADGLTQAVGGLPLLLADGKRVGDLLATENPGFAATRHPRTAVGFDPSGSVLWIAVVDGRQPDHSEGMTLPELATLLESLGATEAVNLDGGGSSVMVLDGVPVSRPSDAAGERAVANALAVVRDRALCRMEH